MESVPVNEGVKDKNVFVKLKDGWRNVVIAVVDSGVTSFLKMGDVGFGWESRRTGWRERWGGGVTCEWYLGGRRCGGDVTEMGQDVGDCR